MKKISLSNHFSIIVAIGLTLVYGYVAYFLERSSFIQLILSVSFLFYFTYFLIEQSKISFNKLFGLSIIMRLVCIVTIPNLSQDFFRFFWDGQLVLQGINPYLENVNYYFENNLEHQIHQAEILRQGMGNLNASHYSNYPAFSQYIYAVAAWFAKDSITAFVISLRVILIGFDILFVFFSKRILKLFNKNPKQLFWYILNPLCILEITLNLHLEGVMIALFITGFYFLLKHKVIISSFFISLSITTKLLSLVFLPVLAKYIFKKYVLPNNVKQIVSYGFWILAFIILQCSFFYNSTFINNFSETVGLWFGKFEFNASIFYVVRWLGYQFYGWNIIETYSKFIPLMSILCFMMIIYKNKAKGKSMLNAFMWMLTIYFLLSTTVHPWYILFPLALGVFTKYNYTYVWSFLVFFSYAAYRNVVFNESLFIIAVYYSILLMTIAYELNKIKINLYLEGFLKNLKPK